MPEAAFDVRRPNSTGLRQHGSRVLHVWRLYRKAGTGTGLAALNTSGPIGFLNTVQGGIRTAREFLRGNVLATLGSGDGNPGRILIKEIRSVLLVDSVTIDPESRSHFSYTRGGKPGENFFIDVPFRNAKGVTRISIVGSTFTRPVSVNGVPVDGNAALVELEKLFEAYFYPEEGTTADYELFWLNLHAPVSAEDPFGASEWWVHPPRSMLRERSVVRRPHLHAWAIELVGLRSNRDLARAEDGFLSSLFGTRALKGLLNKVGLGVIAEGLEQVFGVIDEFKGFLDDAGNVVAAATDYVTGAQQFIRASVAKVRGVFTSVQTIIGRVEDAIEQIRDLPSFTADEIELLRQSFPGLSSSEDSGVILVDELSNLRNLTAAMLAQPQNFAEVVARAPVLPQTIAVRVQPGTSLERVAQAAGVDASALIEANNLQWPFIDARERPEKKIERLEAIKADYEARDLARLLAGLQPQYTDQIAVVESEIAAAELEQTANPTLPNVLYAGDPLHVPQDRRDLIPSVVGITGGDLNAIVSAGGGEASEEDRLFGIDLELTEAGDLVWDADRVDLAVLRGEDNIRAALSRYMRLPLGALRFAPGIGNFAYNDIARWQGARENRMLAYSIFKTLSQDPRVRKVRDVRAVTRGGAASVVFEANLIDGRSVPELRVPVAA